MQGITSYVVLWKHGNITHHSSIDVDVCVFVPDMTCQPRLTRLRESGVSSDVDVDGDVDVSAADVDVGVDALDVAMDVGVVDADVEDDEVLDDNGSDTDRMILRCAYRPLVCDDNVGIECVFICSPSPSSSSTSPSSFMSVSASASRGVDVTK